MDLTKLTPEARAFFDSLTPAMKESIMQTGVKLTNRNDLEHYVQNCLSGAPGVTVNL